MARQRSQRRSVTGAFSNAWDFGSVQLVAKAYADVFVVKLDPTGKALWGASGGSGAHDLGSGVAVDSTGNVVFCGTYGDIATFGSTTLSYTGTYGGIKEAFVAKLDSSGKHLWARGITGAGYDYARSVAVDGSGNIVVGGSFEATASFGGSGSVTSSGAKDLFVSQWTSSGSLSWVTSAGGAGGRASPRSCSTLVETSISLAPTPAL